MSLSSMAASSTLIQIHPRSLTCRAVHTPNLLPSRRQSLLMLTTSISLMAVEARAQDIPLFGLRKKLEKVEEEVVEIVKEGVEVTERGVEAAEKEIVAAAENEIVAVENAVSFGGFAQAGAVVGAETLGVLAATSVVNAILAPESS